MRTVAPTSPVAAGTPLEAAAILGGKGGGCGRGAARRIVAPASPAAAGTAEGAPRRNRILKMPPCVRHLAVAAVAATTSPRHSGQMRSMAGAAG
jgi:hypothetical protein